MRTFLKRSAKWACATLVVAVALGSAVQWTLSQRTLAAGPPPGRLVDVGGHRLHLLCEGSGSPAVILEPGLPGSSLAWSGIADEVAAFATVCTYDRAGYGWSETGPSPRTAGTIVRELNRLLGAAGISPPYVLVGHSFGGLIMQLYAGHFPDQVAGMVLVDSSHPGAGFPVCQPRRCDGIGTHHPDSGAHRSASIRLAGACGAAGDS